MSMEENYRDVSEIRMLSFYAMEDLSHGDLISHVAPGTPGIPDTHTYRFCATKQPNTNLASYQVFEPNRRVVKAGEIFTAAAFYGFVTNEDPANPPETVTTITNTVVGHKIADYTNELGAVVAINETATIFSQNIVDGKITFTNESGTAVDATILSTDAGNTIIIGSDGGVFYDGAGIVSGVSWDDATNTITISFVDGSNVDIPIVDNIVSFINPTIYTQDGSLSGDRTVNGNSHQLNFDSNNGFYVSNNSGDLSLNGSVASIYTSSGNIDITPFGNLILGNIQNNNSADRVLAQNSATGATEFIDVSVLNGNIYNVDGTLIGNRVLDGDNYNHALDFTDLSSFNVFATNFYSESQAGNTIENSATGISLQAMTAGQTLTLQGDIVNLGGVTDTYVSFLAQDDTQNKVLVLDGSDKLFWRDTSSLANNIYNADGVLTSNRALDGDNFNYDLNILNTNNFSVNTFEMNLNADDHAQLSSNGYINFSANTSGSFSANQNLSLNAGTIAELTANDEVNLIAPKTTVSKDFYLNDLTPLAQTDILNIDPLSGNVSYVPLSSIVPNVQNGLSLSGSDIELGGTLLHNTIVNGDSYSFDLSMAQISNFGVEANEISLYSNGMGTFETNGNLNLLSNENLTGGVAKNTDLRSIPDWDLTSDLSGRLYSGNDVLDLFSLFGGNIRGTGFFNKRTSNGISHYIFGGDTTGIGGVPDNIALGITDFGLTNFITEFELVRDDGFGNGSYRVEVANPTSYYNFNVRNENQLLETFANTGFTSQRSVNINSSFYDYLSNNHHYSLRFEELGGQYLELHNQDTVGPENSYTRMFRTNIQNSVSDGILSNGTTLDLTGFNVLNLNDYSGGEKVLVHDSSGDVRKSIAIESFQIRKNINIVSVDTTASPNDLIVYQGGNLGAPFTHTITLPAGTDKDEVTVKVYSSDVLRVDVIGGGLIDGSAFIDIDGTVASKPSVTFVYSSSLGSWIII